MAEGPLCFVKDIKVNKFCGLFANRYIHLPYIKLLISHESEIITSSLREKKIENVRSYNVNSYSHLAVFAPMAPMIIGGMMSIMDPSEARIDDMRALLAVLAANTRCINNCAGTSLQI